jgi:hypothetical protein
MKDAAAEGVAIDSLADLWRQLEKRRSGGVLSCAV